MMIDGRGVVIMKIYLIFIVCMLIGIAGGEVLHVTQTPQYTTIQSAIDASQPGDTIMVSPGVYAENILLNKNLTVDSVGEAIIDGRDLGSTVRVSDHYVTIRNLTVQNGSSDKGAGIDNIGKLLIENCTVRNNAVSGWGGGISNFATGQLTLSNSVVEGNVAGEYGGGIASGEYAIITNSIIRGNDAAWGGGIYADDRVVISDSTIINNHAQFFGGGLLNDLYLDISNSTISENVATVDGGGAIANYGDMVNVETGEVDYNTSHNLYYRRAILNLTDSVLSENVANDYGGGIASDSIINSERNNFSLNHAQKGAGVWSAFEFYSTDDAIVGNNATNIGGGFYNDGSGTLIDTFVVANMAQYGGGLYNFGELSLRGATNLTNNVATTYGGGLYSYAGNVSIENSVRVRANKAHSPTIESNWAHGWGVYYYLSPWFDPAQVVTGNTKI